MPGNSISEFLEWLDVIPGRHWLVLGDAGSLAAAIRADCKPSGVTVGDAVPPPYADGAFDVCILRGTPTLELVEEMRRVVFASGTVGLLVKGGSAADLEALLRQAGLHAVQSRTPADKATFARGAR